MTKQELIDVNDAVERIRKGAYKEGFDTGYDVGYNIGSLDGHIDGYSEGYRDGEDGPPERRLGSIFA